MKKFFSQDSVATGLVTALGAEAATAFLLTLALLIAGENPATHLRWYGACFIPVILLLRFYAKGKQHLQVVKTLIVTFFVTFIGFIFVLFKTHTLQ